MERKIWKLILEGNNFSASADANTDFRLKIIRSYCDKKENIKECINQADKTRFTYSGKDDRKYWPNDIDWPKFAKYMADAGGACPYGTFGSV